MRALLVDNHDSFTFNLYQLMAEVNGEVPAVVRNDTTAWKEIERAGFDCIVISPGPGRPEVTRDFGLSRLAIERSDVPLLGVCLGHQGIAWLAGGAVVPAAEVMHGRASDVTHGGDELFAGIPRRFRAVRYHSLTVDPALPADLEAIAWTDDGVLMAVRHRRRPLWGVQFHPESIGSEHGRRLLENFRDLAARRMVVRRSGPPPASPVPTGRVRPRRSAELALTWRKLDRWVDPEAAFVALHRDSEAAFWLDSSMPGPRGRFSYIGDDRGPLAMRVRHDAGRGEIAVTRDDDRSRRRGRLFDFLRDQLARRRVAADELPFDFQCGFVGYLGYEMKAECGAAAPHPSPYPDAGLLFADRLVAFDSSERAVYAVCLASRSTAGEAERWLAETGRTLESLPGDVDAAGAEAGTGETRAELAWSLRRDRARYLADIAACMEAIRGGQSYELCLTDQLRAAAKVDGLRLHRLLRRSSPAPYAALLRLPGLDIVSSSPERFLTVDRAGRVESRPIKGTRPRGATPQQDAALAADLRAAEKDRAENLMIVDLVRNDLGVVCEPGSVEVPALMQVESYAAVHQLVSTVRGRLRADADALDAIQHAFPPGSMTGAPKQRTMEILDRLEGAARGVYSGALGYLSCSGAVDLSVVIRTAVASGGQVSIGLGGAIVALSDAEAEVEEMLLKGRELVRAVERAAT